ncbi:hypothetical protein IEQ34_002141 [Dendrobium chrysotoxum]|uniref:Uncharacterized protein n=1 Tax=Dendrobium chrysotoxum TaxID=161865 RepID=A0AAV7HL20_DENCH|nr:hypothetical protein IEQ34_002141 [Dendrobium chrysotoxum]
MMTFYLYDWCRESMSKVDSTGRDKCVRHLSACTIYVFAVSMVLPERAFEVDETNWILGSDQLQLIAQSKAIRDALNDIELQKLVYKIDSCSNPEEELDKAMEREGFPQFTEMAFSLFATCELSLDLGCLLAASVLRHSLSKSARPSGLQIPPSARPRRNHDSLSGLQSSSFRRFHYTVVYQAEPLACPASCPSTFVCQAEPPAHQKPTFKAPLTAAVCKLIPGFVGRVGSTRNPHESGPC